MTTAADVISALTGLHTKIAKDIESTPTGVTPGYSAALGGTVMPNGKLRYVGGGATAAWRLIAHCSDATGGITLAGSFAHTVVPYDTVEYDPDSTITTGTTTWVFTAPATRFYRFEPLAYLTKGSNAWADGDSFDLGIYVDSYFNAQRIDTQRVSTLDDADTQPMTHGAFGIRLEIGSEVHVAVKSYSPSDHTVIAAVISIFEGPVI